MCSLGAAVVMALLAMPTTGPARVAGIPRHVSASSVCFAPIPRWLVAREHASRSLIDFNDATNGSRRTYADIRFVTRLAREFAQQQADGSGTGGLTAMVRM